MLRQRVLVALVLLPVGLAAIIVGGLYFFILVASILGLAAWEYAQLFRAGGLQPCAPLVVGGVLAIQVARYLVGFEADAWLVPLLILLSLTFHLVAYERGREQAATDFAVTVAGTFYIGLMGSFLLALRELPQGQWWILVVLPAVWLADSAAYFVGIRFGRHRLSPRLSPKKSWEGYLAGIPVGILGAPLLVLLYQQLGLPPDGPITLGHAAVLGAIMAVFPTLGDLGASMIKRQVGVKDSGNMLPGHGGWFDRIDSWLWAAGIGYFIIQWIFLSL